VSREGETTKRGSREADEGREGVAEKGEGKGSEKRGGMLERSGLSSQGRLHCHH